MHSICTHNFYFSKPKIGKVLVCDLLEYRPDALTNNQARLSYDAFFLQYLFSLLMFKESRLQVCQLIESILLYMPILSLSKVSNMRHLLEYIDDDGLACTCKIFAVTLSNLDSNDKKYLVNNNQRRVATAAAAATANNTATSTSTASASTMTDEVAGSATPGAPSTSTHPGDVQQQRPVVAPSTSTADLVVANTVAIDQTINARTGGLIPSKPSSSNGQPVTSFSIRDQNQDFLLGLPAFLARLVNLVRRKEYTSRFNGLNCELEHWIRSIDEALSDSEDPESSLNFNVETVMNRNAPLVPPPVPPAQPSLNNNNMGENQAVAMVTAALGNNRVPNENMFIQSPALFASSKLNNFVYVLYTISLLLIGKEKKKVQKSLTKLRFAHVLNSLFDHLVWNCNCTVPAASGNTAAAQQQLQRTHTCPEVAVKIQFLRLVHSFCDHSE
jgi:hypothetical protein